MSAHTFGDAVIHEGDCRAVLATLPEASVQCVVTSPPYWGLRDYGHAGQLGLEPLHDCLGWARGENCGECFVCHMVDVFAAVRRVLAEDGTCWVNFGDGYSAGTAGARKPTQTGKHGYWANEHIKHRVNPPGLKPKDLMMMPARIALALQEDGWYLRQDIIWSKPNPMPESVRDRCTKAHEYIFLLSKSARYNYDAGAIKESASENTHARLPGNKKHSAAELAEQGDQCHQTERGLVSYAERKRAAAGSGIKNNDSFDAAMAVMPDTRNKRSVWTVSTKPYPEAHFATFPPDLIRPCILAGCPEGGTVLDPFSGSGTTGAVALEHGRKYIGVELSADYIAMSLRRLSGTQTRLAL